jgi:hypothetical protein
MFRENFSFIHWLQLVLILPVGGSGNTVSMSSAVIFMKNANVQDFYEIAISFSCDWIVSVWSGVPGASEVFETLFR